MHGQYVGIKYCNIIVLGMLLYELVCSTVACSCCLAASPLHGKRVIHEEGYGWWRKKVSFFVPREECSPMSLGIVLPQSINLNDFQAGNRQ